MNDADDINLNMDVLNKNNETYTSITDLYNVHIFTDSDMEKFLKSGEERETYYTDIRKSIFLTDICESDEIENKLFTSRLSLSKKQIVADKEDTFNKSIYLVGIMLCILFILGIVRYNIYRAIRRKKNADNGNIFQWERKYKSIDR